MIYQQFGSEKIIGPKFKRFTTEQYLPFQHPGFATLAIHAGQEPEPIHGSINVPIYLSSTFAQTDINQFTSDFHYSRCGNPTRSALEKCMTKLEYGQYALAFSSFCGGLSSVLHLIKTGNHIIVCHDVYAGIRRYIQNFSQKMHGIQVSYVDMRQVENIRSKIKQNTRLIWLQSPVNPSMRIFDLQSIGKLGQQYKILTVIDNTLSNSYLQSPLLLGIDLSLVSCSKFPGGHSDLIMGVGVTNNKDLYNKLLLIAETQGVNPSPFDCYLVLRGLKTLQIRTIKACQNAYTLAHYLESHPKVQKVYYPGLKDHPQFQIAKKQMRGFGGMLSFDIKGGQEAASKFLRSLKVFTLAESFGGVEGLAEHPVIMTHKMASKQTLEQLGITGNMIRMSVGIQSLQSIINDVQQALEKSSRQ